MKPLKKLNAMLLKKNLIQKHVKTWELKTKRNSEKLNMFKVTSIKKERCHQNEAIKKTK